VISGFLNIYPDPAVPAHLQKLVARLFSGIIVMGRNELFYVEAKFRGCVLSPRATMGNTDVHIVVPTKMYESIVGLETAPQFPTENLGEGLRQLLSW